ncbi:hypothetical protein DL238_01360 [Alteriqipengyuania lutimaris]|uniref:Lipoprotein n=2 Tax=Alteriqipengyuania lutimaris TaxID=1538146 RepID=A0A395LIC7_9SPHN|nr:hypothetical protein DL238_01360 [Alteriqipengyuania lutimaris]
MKRVAALFGLMPLASCAPVGETGPTYAQANEDTNIRVTGEAVSCLSASRIRSSRVIGDGVIDFHVTGGDTYRNHLRSDCPALRRNDAITYEVRGGELCRGEIVYAVDNYGGQLERGPGCGLGEFTPIEYVDSVSDAPETMGE